jgi:hypothetical protein
VGLLGRVDKRFRMNHSIGNIQCYAVIVVNTIRYRCNPTVELSDILSCSSLLPIVLPRSLILYPRFIIEKIEVQERISDNSVITGITTW